jgi:hypothetical protein
VEAQSRSTSNEKDNTKMNNRIRMILTGALLSTAAATARASVPDAPEFGMMGGAAGQVLRVNVMAVDSALPSFVTIVFQDVLGRQVGPAPKSIFLRAGQADSLDLNFSLIGKGRVSARPVVKYLEGSGRAMFTAEYYDQFLGRTVAGSFGGDKFGLPGAVQFGPIGLAHGQIMRLQLGAAAHGGGGGAGLDADVGCVALTGFRRSSGEVVEPYVRMVLSPGQWTSLELSGSKLVRPGQHEDFLPAVQMDPGSPGCVANVQVYDSGSGWTNVYVPGSTGINF